METISKWQSDLDLHLSAARTLYIQGKPGIGKTYAALFRGLRKDQVACAVTLTPSTTVSELRGQYLLRGGETLWRDGVAVEALTNPIATRLVLNELPNASDESLAWLYPLMESPETACVAMPDGRVLRSAGKLQVVCTGNHALDELPPMMRDALKDRMEASVVMPEPLSDAYESFPDSWRASVRASFNDTLEGVSLRRWAYAKRLHDKHQVSLADSLEQAFKGAVQWDVAAWALGVCEAIEAAGALSNIEAAR